MRETTLYRLYIALELLKEGVSASAAPGPLGPMRALLSLDHAVELTLRAVLPEVGEIPKRNDNLNDLLKQLVRAKSGLGSHVREISSVRDIRNSVQHDGAIPSEDQARIAARAVESFLRAVIHETLGKAIEEITLVELVRDPRAKALLRDGEAKIGAGEYADACVDIATAFSWAAGRIAAALLAPHSSSENISDRVFDHVERVIARAASRVNGPGFREFADELHDAFRSERFSVGGLFEPLQKFALFSALGISPQEVRRFTRDLPWVDFSSDGRAWVNINGEWPPTRETASFALRFATNAILKMQAWAADVGPGLNSPS